MATRILLRRDTAANWTTDNPVLALGEEGIETDTLRRKFGDGVTTWTALPYATALPADVTAAQAAAATDATTKANNAQAAAIAATSGQVTDTAMAGALGSSTATAIAGRSELKAAFGTVRIPEAYGAKGDGSTDDATALQAALDAAAGGGRVLLTPGKTYCSSKRLYIGAKTELYGRGATIKNTGTVELLASAGLRNAVWAPTSVTATPSASGGTLAAGAQAYRVTAVTSAGETVACPEVTATTTGSTGSVVVSWTAPTVPAGSGVTITGYNVYGRTSGAIATLLATTASTTFTDTGQAGTAQAFPVTNPTVSRTAGISILGVTFDQNGVTGTGNMTQGQFHSICLYLLKVDSPLLQDVTFTGTPKQSAFICDFTNLRTERINLGNSTSGTFEVLGPGDVWSGSNFSGTTGDDMLCAATVEWPPIAVSEGTITQISLSRLTPAACFTMVRLLGGTGTNFGQAKISDVAGSFGAGTAGIYCNDNQNSPGRAGTVVNNLVVEDVDLVSTSSKPTVYLGATTIGTAVVRGIRSHGDSRTCVQTETGHIGRLLLQDLTNTDGATCNVVNLHLGTIDELDAMRIASNNPTKSGSYLLYVDQATITMLRARGLVMQSSDALGEVVRVNASGTVSFGALTDVHIKNGAAGVYLNGTTASGPEWEISHVQADAVQTLFKTKNATEVHLTNARLNITGPAAIALYGTSASAVIRGSNINLTAGPMAYKDGTQTLRVVGLGVPVDVSKLTKTASDMATNSNAALSCGAGPVICDGTNWKHLFTGATY